MKKQYYIERSQSGFVGNCLLWWRKGGKGYTCDVNQAEVFDGDSLAFIETMKSAKYRAWEVSYVLSASSVHVDHQNLNFDLAMNGER